MVKLGTWILVVVRSIASDKMWLTQHPKGSNIFPIGISSLKIWGWIKNHQTPCSTLFYEYLGRMNLHLPLNFTRAPGLPSETSLRGEIEAMGWKEPWCWVLSW